MKKRQIAWRICIYSLIAVLGLMAILTACAEPEEPAPTTPTPTTPAPTAPAPTAPAPTTPAPTTPAPTTPAPTTPAPKEAKWWDKLGTPKYGGTFTMVTSQLGDSFDQYAPPGTNNLQPYEHLFMWDLTIDREEWSYKVMGQPPKCVGLLAETWEWEDPQTLVVHLRQGVKWQNKAPTYGREFTADDVVYHYDRTLGTGSGFTEPNPFNSMYIDPVMGVSARDKYTVVVKFKGPNPVNNWWAITDTFTCNQIEPREVVELNTPSDWTNVAGTGPFMITDYVSGSSLTLGRNPDYYMYDERYPENQLPYLDELKLLLIIDPSTQLAAIRSGQVDMVFNLDWQIAQNLEKTNPELVLSQIPYNGLELSPRCDTEPFTDIRVRKALQLAIDTQTIAKTHFGGAVSGDPAGYVALEYKGWVLPYEEWPEDLQQEYTYDPDRARQLLAEAGYPDGFDTNCYVQTDEDLDLLQIIKFYLADINVNLTINTMDRNEFIAFLQARKYDQMVANFMSNCTWPVVISFMNRTTKAPTYDIFAPAEEAAVYDDLYAQFTAAPDEATAQKLMIQAMEYAMRQHWQIMTTARVKYNANQPRLRGYSGEAISNMPWFWTRLWVDDSQ